MLCLLLRGIDISEYCFWEEAISKENEVHGGSGRQENNVHRNESDYDSCGADDARDVAILAGWVLLLIFGAISAVILGLIFSGAVRLALATFAALILGALLGWRSWVRMR